VRTFQPIAGKAESLSVVDVLRLTQSNAGGENANTGQRLIAAESIAEATREGGFCGLKDYNIFLQQGIKKKSAELK